MDVILINTLSKIGRSGDVITVKGGFGRYLIQCRDAMLVTPSNLDILKKKQDEWKKNNDILLSSIKQIYDCISDQVLTFIRNAGDDGRLFGSVSKKDIACYIKGILSKKNFVISLNSSSLFA